MYEILNKQEFFFNNVSVKPNEQNKACFSYVMARKCIELNIQVFIKKNLYKGEFILTLKCTKIQINLKMLDSASFFNATHFLKYFHEKMETKKGGGRDGLTPEAFLKHFV